MSAGGGLDADHWTYGVKKLSEIFAKSSNSFWILKKRLKHMRSNVSSSWFAE